MMQIPDPVHGYITLEGMYADIVNTPEFQRLRSIEQVSFRPSYPGARHDRFIHSLGTYHLACKFVDSFFKNLKTDAGAVTISPADKKQLSATFCYAALLHDIGHAPFSHTTEDFFLEQKAASGLPKVWDDLCAAVEAVDSREGKLFRDAQNKVGAAHEIVSALLLVSKWDTLTDPNKKREPVDLALAARMVIGFTYKPGDPDVLGSGSTNESLGIRNCLIQLLNCSTLDVDRLDYMCRDSSLTGYLNAPLDLACLASSVTAVRLVGNWLAPAYRDDALRVFDLMFQAKLSHDAWVIGSPASVYEAELLKHCIRGLGKRIHGDYMEKVFTPAALGCDGITLGDPGSGKHYRFLNDVDVSADLKAQSGKPKPKTPSDELYDELYSRKLDDRRIAAWRSYYEYHHIFNAPELELTPDDVYAYFEPLLNYMAKVQKAADKADRNNILVFDPLSYKEIAKLSDPRITHPAGTLHKYLLDLPTGEDYSVVLLKRTNSFTLKLDPADIRIVFAKRTTPPRLDGKNYSTYSELTAVTTIDQHSENFFYLYRRGGLGYKQLSTLRRKLAAVIKDARKQKIMPAKKEETNMKPISTSKAPKAIGPYSQGMLLGNLVFSSGQIPVDPVSGSIPEGIAAQAEQSCRNVAAVLEAAGTDLTKVVKTTCFLADMADFAAFNEVYAKYFTGKPARSCVAAKALPKGVLCEIEAIAEL